MFGIKHVIILIICAVLITLITVLFKKKDLVFWYRFLLIVGIISETVKVATYIISNEHIFNGYLPKTDLPFQLCSMQLIFIAILNFSSNEKLKRLLLSFMLPTCLVGGVAAMIIATSSSLNNNVITVQYFTYHSAIVAFSIYLLISKKIDWSIKDYRNCLVLLALFGLIAIYLNSMFYDVVEVVKDVDGNIISVEYYSRVNFMYVVDPPASGLPLLNKDHGWGIYMLNYICIAIVGVTICYIKPIVVGIKNKLKAK